MLLPMQKNMKSHIYIYYKDKKLLWTNTKQLKESVILNAPMISQMPELARDVK